MTGHPIDADEARAGLAAVVAQREDLATRLVTPWWYHPALGLLEAVLVLCMASGSTLLMFGGLAVFGAGAGLLVLSYQRLTGLWVSGFRRGPAGRIAGALGALVGASLLAAAFAAQAEAPFWVAVLAAGVVFVGTIVLGRAFDRALRAELRNGT